MVNIYYRYASLALKSVRVYFKLFKPILAASGTRSFHES